MSYVFRWILVAGCCAIGLAGRALPAADWSTAPSYYTHDPMTGQRVTQYAQAGPVYVYPRPDYLKSGFRHSRSSIQVDGQADNYFQVEEWGRPVRPFEEWRFPYRPYGAPYPEWGPNFLPFGYGYAPPYGAGPYGAGPYGAGPYGAGPYGAGPYGVGPYGAGPYGPQPQGPAASQLPYAPLSTPSGAGGGGPVMPPGGGYRGSGPPWQNGFYPPYRH